jgi:hypothetical protein
MSTKTTFKRIALVAVATLGLGMISAAPSSAAGLASDVVALGTPSATATINVATTSSVTLTGYCVSNGDLGVYAIYIKSVPTTGTGTVGPLLMTASSATPVGNVTIGQSDSGNAVDAVIVTCTGTGFYTAKATVSATVPSGGTYVFAVEGVYQAAGKKDWTVTAAAKAPANTTATTAEVFADGVGVGNNTVGVSGPKSDNGYESYIGYIDVVASNGATIGALVDADAKAFTATIAGPGNLYWEGGGGFGRAITSPAGDLSRRLFIYSDLTAGKSTITITDGGFTKTVVVNFYGAATSYAVGDTIPDPVVSALGVGNTQTWEISTLDANGVTVSTTPTLYAVSSNTSILAVSTSAGSVTATGVKAGSATFTICDTALCASPTVKLGPVAVTVTNKKADSATFTLNKSDYQVGEAFTLTITAKDAAGVLADGTYANMAKLTTSVLVPSTTGSPISQTLTPSFTNGVATVKGFMPAFTGPVTFTLTLGVKGTPGVADAAAGAALTATANVGSAAVDAATAAVDAAAEATDAANAATDAANAAAEAADAATAAAQDAADAVAALSAQVTEMIAALQAQNNALRKQLIALTNLIIKIQKKVKA